MKIDFNELKKFVSNKKNESHINAFSAILKRERLSKDMTLEEVSNGICSVSYLSKLENNQIEPRNEYVRFLFDKLAIDYDHVVNSDYETMLKDFVKYYYYGEVGKICESFGLIDFSLFDCNASLCGCFYHLANLELSEASKCLEEVDTVKNCLNDYSFLVYVYLLSEYSVISCEYNNGYKYLSSIKESTIQDATLKNLIYENIIVCSFHTKKYFELICVYKSLNFNGQITFPNVRKNRCELLYKIVIGLDDFRTKEELKSFIENSMEVVNEGDNYYLALMGLCKFRAFHDVIDIIESSGLYLRSDICALYGFAILESGLRSKYLGFLQLIQKIESVPNDKCHLKFIELAKMKMENCDKVSLYEFVRYNALSFSNLYPHNLYDEFYGREYVDLLVKFSKYKDSTLFLREKLLL